MRTALVTGAAKGIGFAIAQRLKADGLRVVGTYHGDAEAAARAEARLGIPFLQLDVTDAAQCDRVVAEAGVVDVLVNNAGVVKDQFLRFFPDADWHALIDANLTGAFHMARAAMPGMIARRWGRLIAIGSYVGVAGVAGRSGYAAAKAGLLGLTRSLAREGAEAGITANAIAPGLIMTERTRQYREAVLASTIAQVPLGRAGEPEEVAAMAAFLARPEAGYVTGQIFLLDGGLSMREWGA